MAERTISAAFPFVSRYVEVLGSRMHYVEEGAGDPVLFIHGNPTWSYLWRNIIPHVSPLGRCIAVDLIGMGKSDKPDIGYGFFDHARYLDGFIEGLGLKDITLVFHDWGSALGFHYARRREGNVRAIAFMESIVRPLTWEEWPEPALQLFLALRTPGVGERLVMENNVFIEQVLPAAVLRTLSDEEMEAYRAPFRTEASRKPIWKWAQETPIEGQPKDVHDAVQQYSEWLCQSSLPKLLMYSQQPGAVMRHIIEWCRQNMPNLKTVDIGESVHFGQEDRPHEIGEAIAAWMREEVVREPQRHKGTKGLEGRG